MVRYLRSVAYAMRTAVRDEWAGLDSVLPRFTVVPAGHPGAVTISVRRGRQLHLPRKNCHGVLSS